MEAVRRKIQFLVDKLIPDYDKSALQMVDADGDHVGLIGVKTQNVDLVNRLLKSAFMGEVITLPNSKTRATSLMMAAAIGNLDMVNVLLPFYNNHEAFAALDAEGKSAFDYAEGFSIIIKRLESFGKRITRAGMYVVRNPDLGIQDGYQDVPADLDGPVASQAGEKKQCALM